MVHAEARRRGGLCSETCRFILTEGFKLWQLLTDFILSISNAFFLRASAPPREPFLRHCFR